jgi:hypothetical protein
MNQIPDVGDTVYIDSNSFKGDATVTYIDQSLLFDAHMYPIQVEINEADLDQFTDFNSGQTLYRTNLTEINAIHNISQEFTGSQQGDLFDI